MDRSHGSTRRRSGSSGRPSKSDSSPSLLGSRKGSLRSANHSSVRQSKGDSSSVVSAVSTSALSSQRSASTLSSSRKQSERSASFKDGYTGHVPTDRRIQNGQIGCSKMQRIPRGYGNYFIRTNCPIVDPKLGVKALRGQKMHQAADHSKAFRPPERKLQTEGDLGEPGRPKERFSLKEGFTGHTPQVPTTTFKYGKTFGTGVLEKESQAYGRHYTPVKGSGAKVNAWPPPQESPQPLHSRAKTEKRVAVTDRSKVEGKVCVYVDC